MDGSLNNLEPNSSVAMLAAIVAFFLPAAIDAIKRSAWPSPAKAICAFIVCLVASFATAWIAGSVSSASDLATAAIVVTFLAIASYKLYWQPSGMSAAIEEKTG